MPTNIHRLITHQTGWLNTSRPITAEDLQGRIILLDFWTYCCINCMHVIPDLKYLEEKFGDKLTVIGIHSAKFKNEKDSENIRQAILRYGLHHPVVNDFDFSTWKAFGVRAWPTFVLINPKGIIEEMYSGEGNRDAVAHDIEALIKKYDGKINTEKLPIALEQDKAPSMVLSFPSKLAYMNNFRGKPALAVSDSGHNRIVIMSLDGTILDSIGDGQQGWKDGHAREARFNHPQGLLISKDGAALYVADTENHLIRLVNFEAGQNCGTCDADGMVSTLAGTGKQGFDRKAQNAPALSTALASPWDVAFYPDDKHLVIAMAGLHQLWSYDIDAKTVSVIAGSGSESIEDGKYPDNALAQTSGLSAANNQLYFVDAETSSLRMLDHVGEVNTLIGTGLFDFGYKEGIQGTARMQHPLGVYAERNHIYVADSYNHSIRLYDTMTYTLSNFAGHGERGNKDGALAAAEFNEPNDVLQVGDKLYVADTNNNAIRVIDLKEKKVSTLSIGEATPAAAPEFSETLPNMQKSFATQFAVDIPVTLTLELKYGWHINADAPSYLAVFDASKKAIASFDHKSLVQQHVTLPAMPPGNYRLQTTIYYCEDKAGAQCLIKSFDVPFATVEKGLKEPALNINRPPIAP